MKKLRGRYLAFALSIIAVLTLAAAVFVFRDQLREQWCLLMLDSSEPKLRDLAIRELGEIGSVRAIQFAEEALASPDQQVRMSGQIVLFGILAQRPEAERVPVLLRHLDNSDQMVQSNAGFALRSLLEGSWIKLSREEIEKLDRISPKWSRPPNPSY